jgi:hypothetical protein
VLTRQCVDIEFAEPEDVEEVTRDNCFNSSHIDFEFIYTTAPIQANEAAGPWGHSMFSALPVVLAGLFGFLMM